MSNILIEDKEISLGQGLPQIPERLLLAHSQGQVLFVVGAGVSVPSGLPGFEKLVVNTMLKVDPALGSAMDTLDRKTIPVSYDATLFDALNDAQKAEFRRFEKEEYDVVLGMVERRLDVVTNNNSRVREAIRTVLSGKSYKHNDLHRFLLKLSDRGGSTSIVSTKCGKVNKKRITHVLLRSNTTTRKRNRFSRDLLYSWSLAREILFR